VRFGLSNLQGFISTLTVAIYSRRSVEQNGVADEAKSIARQVAHAKAYAAKKGWAVADEHVYVDDGVSGALFGASRPGLARLLAALTPRPPFQVLVMSEESRLGREAIETAWALKRITDAGVRVFFYLDDRERTLDSPTDKVMLSLTAFAAEMERDRARVRTHDALMRKAKSGHVTGGVIFGYVNRPVLDGARRSHVERVVDPREAAVVRRIFTHAAEGWGSSASPAPSTMTAPWRRCRAERADRAAGRHPQIARFCTASSTAAW